MPSSQSKDAFPAYHNEPLTLTTTEISNPYLVIENFFDTWHLPQMRHCMREWLYEAIQKNEAPAYNFLWLHDELTRLAEAAWLLGEQNRVSIASKKQKIKLASNELNKPVIKKRT